MGATLTTCRTLVAQEAPFTPGEGGGRHRDPAHARHGGRDLQGMGPQLDMRFLSRRHVEGGLRNEVMVLVFAGMLNLVV